MTTVLFGAGAESSFGLANGKQFSFNVLGVGNDSLNSALDIIRMGGILVFNCKNGRKRIC